MKNKTRHALARIPLRWMIRECFQANTGIIFYARALEHEIGLDMEKSGSGLTPKAPDLPQHTTQYLARRETAGVVEWVSDTLNKHRWIRRYLNYPIHWERVFIGEAQEELNDAVSPFDTPLDKWYWRLMQKMPGM